MSEASDADSADIGVSGSITLGKTVTGEQEVTLPLEALKRHVMAIGGSGSGKTVLCKCIVEEAVRNNIPALIIDPQGDISSLAIRGDVEELIQHGTGVAVQNDFFSKARVTIFSPASKNAIPICVNPFRSPSLDFPREEAILALDLTAESLVGYLGYDVEANAGRSAKAYIFTILEYAWQHGQTLSEIAQLAEMVVNPPEEIAGTLRGLVAKREPEEIARKLRFLTVGASSLLFQMGTQIDIDRFMDKSDGKVPVNIIYLNTLTSENEKQFLVATLLKELYCWMLKNPSNNLQMLFYVDEISPYIPPYPRNPPPKNAYSLLFKQARKYGIGLVAATQNITDIDYKALAQVNTWCIGRLMTTQDIARVQKTIQSIDPAHAEAVLKKLPSLRTGEFLLLSPDLFSDAVDFKVRWLASKHLTIDQKDLAQYISNESRQIFEKHTQSSAPKKETPTVQLMPSATLEQKTHRLLSSERRAVLPSFVADSLNISREDSEKALASLVKTGKAKKERSKAGEETVYWLSEYSLKPSRGIDSDVLVISTVISQADAVKKSKSMLQGGRFSKDEEVVDALFSYLPLWKINAVRETRTFLIKKEEAHTYFASAETGALVSLERREIVFHRLLSAASQKLRNIDEDTRFIFVPKLPNELDMMPEIKLSKEKMYRTLELKIGAKAQSAELVLLPIWTLRIQHKIKNTRRVISIDAATGRLVTGMRTPRT
jgi:hypothetical protein